MKKLFFFILLLPVFAFAQTKVIKHTVVASESFSSIAKLYNVNAKTVAAFNKLDYTKGLAVGQVLKIQVPATAKTTGVKDIKEPKLVKDTKAIPPVKEKPVVKTEPKVTAKATMHTVGTKETLYGISKMYGVTVANIKKWNKLTTDALADGMELIVGYGTTAKMPTVKPVEPKIVEEDVQEVKPEPKKKPKPAEVKQVIKEISNGDETNEGKNFNGGFFKSLYRDNGKILEGVAGVFKSTSGWDDGKYYCLHNSAKQGTIIKVTNMANGKTIYAKVLDIMPDLKQNEKLMIRISNAAADALGETTATSINVAISY